MGGRGREKKRDGGGRGREKERERRKEGRIYIVR